MELVGWLPGLSGDCMPSPPDEQHSFCLPIDWWVRSPDSLLLQRDIVQRCFKVMKEAGMVPLNMLPPKWTRWSIGGR